jgi:hypothetical protein
MSVPNIRPWRHHGELLQVRGLLYHAEGIDVEERARQIRLGVNIVSFWKVEWLVLDLLYFLLFAI